MNPSQALKQKIEADAVNYQIDAKPSTRKYSSLHYIQEDYCAGAQSLVPLVESLVEMLELINKLTVEDPAEGPELRARAMVVYCRSLEALTNYRKFIGG